MDLIFVITAIIAVLSSIMVITRRNAVHALLYLVVSFFAVAMIFFIAGAPFVGIMELIIYAGAIITLFVFVVMMLNMGAPLTKNQKRWMAPSAWMFPVLLVVVLQVEFLIVILKPGLSAAELYYISPERVGYTLITKYIIAVELAGMLLMAGIIGAYHLGKRKKKVIHRYLEKINES